MLSVPFKAASSLSLSLLLSDLHAGTYRVGGDCRRDDEAGVALRAMALSCRSECATEKDARMSA